MSSFRLAELVGGLSLAADYANGYPPEKCLRSAVLSVAIGRRAGLSEDALRDGYWVTVLRFLGCTAFAHEEAHVYGAGDDLRVRNTMGMADATNPLGTLRSIASNVAKDAPLFARGRAVARLLSEREAVEKHARAQCDQSIHLAEIVDVSAEIRGALAQACERFDGKGAPNAIEGEALAASTRLLHIADILEICLHRSGVDYARSELERRSGKHLDPVLVRAALSELPELDRLVSGTSVWEAFLEAEPGRHAERTDPTRVATAFAHFADAKSVYTLGHSTRVAEIAERAGASIGLGVDALAGLRAAALLHDVGRVAVPNGIWDKPGPLGASEWERVRLHAYYTERIALRAPAWARAAKIAAGAHERPDGSGYHRGLPHTVLTIEERVLAAADVFAALLEPRAHRPAIDAARAADVMWAEVKEQKLDANAVDAVLGGGAPSRPRAPSGLSDREVEVLRLLARGKTNKEIGSLLGISARTVQNHVAHIYDKAGVYSRAGAALFATENNLLD